MIRLIISLGLFVCVFFGVLAAPTFARDATWTRNTEPDMKQYRVWLCKVAGCVVQRTNNTPFALVEQTPLDVTPSVTIPDDLAGDAAVDAVDQAGNASPLSNHASFSVVLPDLPPAAPVGFSVR
jgi:hypothetical protein